MRGGPPAGGPACIVLPTSEAISCHDHLEQAQPLGGSKGTCALFCSSRAIALRDQHACVSRCNAAWLCQASKHRLLSLVGANAEACACVCSCALGNELHIGSHL